MQEPTGSTFSELTPSPTGSTFSELISPLVGIKTFLAFFPLKNSALNTFLFSLWNALSPPQTVLETKCATSFNLSTRGLPKTSGSSETEKWRQNKSEFMAQLYLPPAPCLCPLLGSSDCNGRPSNHPYQHLLRLYTPAWYYNLYVDWTTSIFWC